MELKYLIKRAAVVVGILALVSLTAVAQENRSVLPAAKISLDGPTHIETQSNHEGKFVLSAIPAGSYAITAQAPESPQLRAFTLPPRLSRKSSWK